MKKFVITTIGCFALLLSMAQSYDYLDINNIKCKIPSYGTIFKGSGGLLGFEAPQGSGSSPIYAANLWIGGKNNSAIHCTAATFEQTGSDWQPGPIMNAINYPAEVPNWDKVWKVHRDTIDWFVNCFVSGLCGGFTIPNEIMDWPAHGNTSLGQSFYLAPFKDVDGDGIYNPVNGDYPIIKGDQAIWFIFNDDKEHLSSGGDSMKVEVHGMAYAMNCVSSEALTNTIFLEYKIINRSSNTYDSTWIGMWNDFDLGCPEDDFIGCDVVRGLSFAYNGDLYDESCNGATGYQNNIPAIGCVFLGGPVADDDGTDNPIIPNTTSALSVSGIPYEYLGVNYSDGIIDNERLGVTEMLYHNRVPFGNAAQQDPNNDNEYYYYMRGMWKDGTNMVYGGNAHISDPTIFSPITATNYMFPDDSDPLFWGTRGDTVPVWSELSSGNLPGDRRGLGASGPFTFAPGDTAQLDLAYSFAQDTLVGSHVLLQQFAEEIHEIFRADSTPCGLLSYTNISEQNLELKANIYPNPANEQLNIEFEESGQYQLQVMNILGDVVFKDFIGGGTSIIDVTQWSEGIYVIYLQSEKGALGKKLIIAK